MPATTGLDSALYFAQRASAALGRAVLYASGNIFRKIKAALVGCPDLGFNNYFQIYHPSSPNRGHPAGAEMHRSKIARHLSAPMLLALRARVVSVVGTATP